MRRLVIWSIWVGDRCQVSGVGCWVVGAGAMNRVRDVRPVRPIDSIQPLAIGALHPPLHGLEAHVKPARHRTQRGTPPNRGNHLSTSLLGPAFLRTLTPELVFRSNTINHATDLDPVALLPSGFGNAEA